MCLHIKVVGLNTLSDGKVITGILQFFIEMGNKKRRNTNLGKLFQLHVFLFFKCKFEKFLMNVKAMCLCIKVAELNTLSVGKGIPGIPSTVFSMRWKIQMKTCKFT